MKQQPLLSLDSVSAYHRISGLPPPEHPLVSVIDYSLVDYQTNTGEISWIQGFYSVGYKRNMQGKFRYGQQQYDFDEGLMSFVGPGQVVRLKVEKPLVKPSGLLLCFHPDFLWNTSLATGIRDFDFFGYAVKEALFMSEKEEAVVTEIMHGIQREYHSNIDDFSQGINIARLELLFRYCERFYRRQFITRKQAGHELLERLEEVLEQCFRQELMLEGGVLTAQFVAGELNVSPNYLGSLLKTLTGQTTQQHIQNKLIERAKQRLSTTSLSVSEIAYELGFGHPQSFSRLFKRKAGQSPREFRESFN